jgi:hypothetical protein
MFSQIIFIIKSSGKKTVAHCTLSDIRKHKESISYNDLYANKENMEIIFGSLYLLIINKRVVRNAVPFLFLTFKIISRVDF